MIKVSRGGGKNNVFFIIDPSFKHPGLADRLKAICCSYYIAKINGFNFKLIFEKPFKLSDYIIPNKINWLTDEKELSYSLHNSRILEYNPFNKIPKLGKKVKQYHIYLYTGKNILQTNNVNDWQQIWHDSYNDLFKPSERLRQALNSQPYVPRSYVAVHFRFVNALENFEEIKNQKSIKYEKDVLINKCLNKLKCLQSTITKPIIVFSDSNLFLDSARKNGFITLNGNIGHISFRKDANSVLKTFVDFYMIGQADTVYRAKSSFLYATAFSMYAAIANNAKFQDLQID